MLRLLLRKSLYTLSRLVLRKHQPVIIAVTGDGRTAIAREAVFTAVSTKYAARRNVEVPEAEFSIPLTILGYPNYPKSWWEWLWVLLKTSIQVITVRPYQHMLVLELTALSDAVLQYWLQISKPKYLLQIDSSRLEDFQKSAQFQQLIKDLNLDPVKAAQVLANLRFPEARIEVYPGPNGSLVVDSTYYYFPIRLDSVLEVARELGTSLVMLTTDAPEIAEAVSVNPPAYQPHTGDVILLRGRKTDVMKSFAKFASKP